MRLTTKFMRFTFITLLVVGLLACGGGGGTSLVGTNDPKPADPPTNEEPPANVPNTVSAIIGWDIPTTRRNGDELLLSEIGGYEIIYRKTSEQSFVTVVVESATSVQYTVNNLTPGEYEVRIAAFDTDGLYSDYSNSAVATIGI